MLTFVLPQRKKIRLDFNVIANSLNLYVSYNEMFKGL